MKAVLCHPLVRHVTAIGRKWELVPPIDPRQRAAVVSGIERLDAASPTAAFFGGMIHLAERPPLAAISIQVIPLGPARPRSGGRM